MQQDLLPLFPLRMVLLPGSPVALHIFEDRYKEMIGHAIETQTEFGIVLASDDTLRGGDPAKAVISQYELTNVIGRLTDLTITLTSLGT